jgi:hypothetical protein
MPGAHNLSYAVPVDYSNRQSYFFNDASPISNTPNEEVLGG